MTFAADSGDAPARPNWALELSGVSRRFGGLWAVNAVNLRVAAGSTKSIAPSGQIAVTAIARGFGIGHDHRDIRPDEIRPIMNPPRIPPSNDENNRRGIRHALSRKAISPAGVDPSSCGQSVDVDLLIHGDDVRRQSSEDGADLRGRSAMRLFDRHRLSARSPPVCGEDRIIVRVKLPRHVVGHIEKLVSGGPDRRCKNERQ